MISVLEAPVEIDLAALVPPAPAAPRAFWQLEPDLEWHSSGDGHTVHVNNCSLRTVARYRASRSRFCLEPILDGYTTTAHGDPHDVEELCRLANSYDFASISSRLLTLPFTVRLKTGVNYETRCGRCGDHIWLSSVPAGPVTVYCGGCHEEVIVV